MTVEKIVHKLINGEVCVVPDQHRHHVKERLKEIKENCTIVLSQIKDWY